MDKYLYLIAILCIVAQAWAIDCENNVLSMRADTGNYAYGEVSCTSERGLDAHYSGNLSGYVKVFIEEKGTEKYLIRFLADVRSSDTGVYKGEIILSDRDEKEYSLKTRIRVGESEEDSLTLSAYNVHLKLGRLNKTECSYVEITNSGTSELSNLRAECTTEDITSPEYGNGTWIMISDVSEGVFSPGEKKTLQVCVNTLDDHPNLKTRDTKIAVYADSVSDSKRTQVRSDLSVSLETDLETIWQQKYDLLKDQHQMLQKSYNGLAAYKNALAAEDNDTGNGTASDLSTYSGLAKTYAELKDAYAETERMISCSNASSIDQLEIRYKNLQESYLILETGYGKLLKNASAKVPKETLENLTKERDAIKAEHDSIQKEIENLQSILEEKDALLLSMSMKQKENKTQGIANNSAATMLLPPEYAQYAPLALIPLAGFPFLAFCYIRRQRKAKKKAPQPAPPAQKEEKKEGPKEQDDALRAKELQKEALRQLLLQKLAEKAAEKNGKI